MITTPVAVEIGPLRLGPIAHGGHCVARHEGRVVFVRHGLPGELVTVRLTDTSKAAYWRGDAVRVHEAGEQRVNPRCPVSGPDGCGGCDFQHVSPHHQRELKRQVVAEQLQRLAGLTWDGEVEAVAPDGPWRTRMRWFSDGAAHWGLRKHRSHEVIALPDQGCGISLVAPPGENAGHQVAEVTAGGRGEPTIVVDGERIAGPAERTQRVGQRSYRVAADGFWQVHPAAAQTLTEAVVAGLDPQSGERALDLYCGVGLFAGALVDHGVRVWGVEGSRSAVARARRNVSEAKFFTGPVARTLPKLPEAVDLIVLDPPRKGAGGGVMRKILDRRPRGIAYVACDPAALARDVGTASAAGWAVSSIRAFDLFPMTHHVECVAILTPSPLPSGSRLR